MVKKRYPPKKNTPHFFLSNKPNHEMMPNVERKGIVCVVEPSGFLIGLNNSLVSRIKNNKSKKVKNRLIVIYKKDFK